MIGLVSASAQKRVENHYIINGVGVEDFDGSQIEGKRIKKYHIETSKNGKEAFHFIITDQTVHAYATPMKDHIPGEILAHADSIRILSDKVVPEDPVFVLNGEKIITKDEFAKLSVKGVKSIAVIKGDKEIVKKYSAEGRGVVMIWTKNQ